MTVFRTERRKTSGENFSDVSDLLTVCANLKNKTFFKSDLLFSEKWNFRLPKSTFWNSDRTFLHSTLFTLHGWMRCETPCSYYLQLRKKYRRIRCRTSASNRRGTAWAAAARPWPWTTSRSILYHRCCMRYASFFRRRLCHLQQIKIFKMSRQDTAKPNARLNRRPCVLSALGEPTRTLQNSDTLPKSF